MSKEDVTTTLSQKEGGSFIHATYSDSYIPDNAPEAVTQYYLGHFEDLDFLVDHELHFGLGYNSKDELVWVSRSRFFQDVNIICP